MPTPTQGSQLAPTSTVTDGTRSFPPTPKTVVVYSRTALTKKEQRAVDWDREVRRRAEEAALQLAEGDPTRAIVYRAAIMYRRSFDVHNNSDILDNTGEFWLVGRNASHQFYLGFDLEGNLARASYGDDVLYEGVHPEWSLEKWRKLRDEDNAFHRNYPSSSGAPREYTAGICVRDGKLCRHYTDYLFEVSRIDDPNNIGYLGHY